VKKVLMTAAAATLLAATGLAQAQDGAAIAKESGCLKCHVMNAKKTGPSIKSIAAEFKKAGVSGDKAVARMKEKHEPEDLKGVKSDADLKAAVGYFLSQ
jgi:cytochrome c551/c552